MTLIAQTFEVVCAKCGSCLSYTMGRRKGLPSIQVRICKECERDIREGEREAGFKDGLHSALGD